MRIFIEQFARRQTGLSGKKTGDEIMSAYAETLPAQHRPYMPSLREWYEKLSQAIHGAKEDEELFEEARKEIERHFDIRRVFGILEIADVAQKPFQKNDARCPPFWCVFCGDGGIRHGIPFPFRPTRQVPGPDLSV